MIKKRILFIDDEAGVTRSISLRLEILGVYEVRTENQALRAVETAREFMPDLIFLDVMMPEMDGGDVAKELEADPLLKGSPIVFLTALVTNQETKGHEAHSGRWSYLAKPVDLAGLVKCIKRHLPN
jgi:CheY-like chemotaxis protein